MNPKILELLQKYGLFAGMQPTVPQVQTMNPQGLLGTVHATPNNALGGMNTVNIPSPTAAALPADPAAGGASFGAKYGPMFRTAADILNQRSAPPPQPQPFLHPLFWNSQGGSY